MSNPVNHLSRSYFFNIFERHNPDKLGRHSYNMLDRANIALDSRFSVEASFFEVWRGLIDTPRSDWRFERTIFCLENKGDMSCGFNRKNEYFVLPAEAMVNMLDNDKATHEVGVWQTHVGQHEAHIPLQAVVSFHFNHKIFKLPDNEVHDDLKLCSFEKPSTQYIKNKVGEASYIVSLRISSSSSIPSGIKKALLRMDATFQSTYNRIMEVVCAAMPSQKTIHLHWCQLEELASIKDKRSRNCNTTSRAESGYIRYNCWSIKPGRFKQAQAIIIYQIKDIFQEIESEKHRYCQQRQGMFLLCTKNDTHVASRTRRTRYIV